MKKTTRLSAYALCCILAVAIYTSVLSAAPAAIFTLSVTTTNDTLIADADCSLREAIETVNTLASTYPECYSGVTLALTDPANEFVIDLPAGTYMLMMTGANEDANQTGDFDILNDVTINGTGATTIIDPGMMDRAFHVMATTNINNVAIQNGMVTTTSATDGGGAILNSATLNIDSVVISNNSVTGTGASGGGILNDMGVLTVSNSTFSMNTSVRAGGGIESNVGDMTITNTDFDMNSTGATPGNGGAIHITGAGSATITGGNVTNNTASAEGGGFWNGSGTMTVDGTTFTGNVASGAGADQGGGALFNVGGTLDVMNATITGNDANGAAGSGGGILTDGGVLTVSNTTIDMNTSMRAGGGIEATNSAAITVDGTDFTANSTGASPGNGGAIHLTGAVSADITGGIVMSNTASAEGGGFWNGIGTMTVDGTTFSGNVASGASADQGGGALFNAGGTLDITNATITGNDANGTAGSGGGILNDMGILTVSSSVIDGNTSMRAGGGIESNIGDITVQNTDFDSNSTGASPGNGGAIHITGAGASDIQGGVVSNNFASAEGGGFWNGSGTMTVLGTTFLDNEAAGAGADQGGGALFNAGGTLVATQILADGNTATGAAGSGGAILNDMGDLTVILGNINNNMSMRAGGGIESNVGNTTLFNTSFDMNSTGAAPGNGGALHITGAGNTFATGGDVTNNTASAEGGGFWNGSGTMTINATDFLNNSAAGDSADQGGGGLFNAGGTLIVSNSDIDGNMATGASGSGGGVLNDMGVLTITMSTITDNDSNRAGGGVEAVAGSTYLEQILLDGNSTGSAPGNGGGLHLTGAGLVTVKDSTVSNNTASNEGGGLWNSVAGTFIVDGTTVNNNQSPLGAGLHNDGGMFFAYNTTVSMNTGDGFANVDGGMATLTHVTIYANTLGINNVDGAVSISNSIVSDCTGTISAMGVNLDEDGSCMASITADPMLGALIDNGGFNATHLPMDNSPVVDVADNGVATASPTSNEDQRDVNRTLDSFSDLGAVEREAIDGMLTIAKIVPSVVTLSGANEVPPVDTSAMGEAILSYDPATGMLDYHITVTADPTMPITITMAHIHTGAAGSNGGVLVGILSGGPYYVDDVFTFSGSVAIPDSEVATLLAQGHYINIHTTANPGGELRGQILPPPVTTIQNPEYDPAGDKPVPQTLPINFFVSDPLTGEAVTLTGGTDVSYALPIGTYSTDEITIPDGWMLADSACSDGSMPGSIMISEGEMVTCSFTNVQMTPPPVTGRVSNMVWSEMNGDGMFTAGVDMPLSGVLVRLRTDNGIELFAQTDMNGMYLFEDVPVDTMFTVDVSSATLPVDKQGNVAVDPDGTLDGMVTTMITSDVPGDFTLGFGYTATVPPMAGTLIISKIEAGQQPNGTVTLPRMTPFTFTDPTDPNATFILVGGDLRRFTVDAGTYMVNEMMLDGWILTGATCDNGDDPQTGVTVGEGETVNCSFTNEEIPAAQNGILVIEKAVTSSSNPGTTPFMFTDPRDASMTFTMVEGESRQFVLSAGMYSVNEMIPNGWRLVGATCSNGDDPMMGIALGEGEMVTCTFTNEEMPVVIPDDGMLVIAKAVPSMISLSGMERVPFIDTNAMGEAMLTYNPATIMLDYQVMVTADPEMPLTITGAAVHINDNGADGGVLVSLLDGVSIVVDDQYVFSGSVAIPASAVDGLLDGRGYTLHVHTTTYPDGEIIGLISAPDTPMISNPDYDPADDKETDPAMIPLPFTFNDPTDPSNMFTIGGNEQMVFTVTAGAYIISERMIPDGWMLSDMACSNGDDPMSGVMVGEGETVICAFTNMMPEDVVLGSISSVIWSEMDGDMMYTAGVDTPLAGVLVRLTTEDGMETFAQTDMNGMYMFNNIPVNAMYTIDVIQSTLPLDKQGNVAADPDGTLDGTSMSELTANEPDDMMQGFGFMAVDDPAAGVLMITKVEQGADGGAVTAPGITPFIFTDPLDSNMSFTLVGGESRQFSVDAGTYMVSEMMPDGWSLVSATCDNGDDPQSGVMVGEGEVITCTFTNMMEMIDNPEAGTLVITKVEQASDGSAVASPGSTPFTFMNPLDANQTFTLVGGESRQFSVDAGTYMVSEMVPDGWSLIGSTCDNGGDPQAGVMVGEGETVTCTFRNMMEMIDNPDAGALIITKVEQASDGGAVASPGSTPFTFMSPLDANQTFTLVGGESRQFSVDAGTYMVSEMMPDGWSLTSATCDNNGDPQAGVMVGEGETVTCTFTNMMDEVVIVPPPVLGSISNIIWSEVVTDGVYVVGEDTPLNGVIVRLDGSDGSERFAETGEDGMYMFNELPVDVEYTVTVVIDTLPDVKQRNYAVDPDTGEPDGMSVVMLSADAPNNTMQGFGFIAVKPTAVSTIGASGNTVTWLPMIATLLTTAVAVTTIVEVRKRVE